MKFTIKSSTPLYDTVGRWEDILSLAALLSMAILPSVEVFTRLFRLPGIPGSAVIVQHLTLWIGFLGAILAARQNRLLALTRSVSFEEQTEMGIKNWFAKTVSVAAIILLAVASYHLVRVEFEYPTNVLPGVPRWVAESIMPIGFFLIAIELLRQSGKELVWKALTVVVVVIVGAIGLGETLRTPLILWLGILSIGVSIVFGAPIFVGLGGIAVLLFWYNAVPISAIPAEMYRMVVKPTLPTIPLFTLTGYILAEGGASRRLIEVFRHWFGWVPGGTPVVVTLLCGFFTALTGGSGVTILALGGLLLPMLLAQNYSKKFSIGLITVSGSLGLLFPPSLPAILYSVGAGVSVYKIFIAGIIPGFLLIFFVALWGVRHGIKSNVERIPFQPKLAFSALWKSKWEVILPILIIFGIFGGFTTIVEVSALTVIYALFVETVIYKDLKLSAIPGVIVNCATLIGGVLIIIGVAMGLTSYLVDAQIPFLALDWVKANIHSKYVFLFILNILLLMVGCMMDIFSAIIVVVPLIKPMAVHFGIDPIHMGIIFIANLELGFLTPPVGLNLFLSAYRFNKSMPEVYTATLPFFIIMLLAVLAITYVPILSLGLLG